MQLSKACISIVILLNINISFSQVKTTGKIEISLITDYFSSGDSLDFIVTSMCDQRWDWDKYLTNDFDDASLYRIPEQTDTSSFATYGWNFYGSSTPGPPLTKNYENVCYGIYKFYWTKTYGYPPAENIISDSFYYDLRDDRYPGYPPYSTNDTQIKFIESITSPRFFIRAHNSSSWDTIFPGDIVTQWDIIGVDPPASYVKFQPTTPNNLTVTWSNNRPLLTWNCSEPSQLATYEIWRKVMGGRKYLQIIEDWCCISYTGAGDTTYSDNGFSSGSGYKAYYKVRAVSGDGNLYSPGWTNTVSVIGNFTPNSKGKIIDVRTFEPVEKSISVSPNPFNNTAHISMESGNSPVSDISIYDLTGRVIYSKQLNGHIGYYDIIWNARDPNGLQMRSGMYFLIVRSGRKILFREKLLYLK